LRGGEFESGCKNKDEEEEEEEEAHLRLHGIFRNRAYRFLFGKKGSFWISPPGILVWLAFFSGRARARKQAKGAFDGSFGSVRFLKANYTRGFLEPSLGFSYSLVVSFLQ
jgi:hypothetical protein